MKVIKFIDHKRTYADGNWRGNTRVFFWVDTGEGFNLVENLLFRESRPWRLYRPVVKQLLAEHGVTYESLHWNQRAGCSCPCSPGFILKGHTGHDIYITVQPEPDDENLQLDPSKAYIAEWRASEIAKDPTLAPLIGI